MVDTSIIIRVMYNNQSWKEACKKPGEDLNCELCLYPSVNIEPFKKGQNVCLGNCWERYLCKDFKWGCYPKGNTFARAYAGMKAYFVFKSFSGLYTIWGTSTISSIDKKPMKSDKDYEDGFIFVHFKPFSQLPPEKWIPNLTDPLLVGNSWRQGRYRYIGKQQELYLEELLRGEKPERELSSPQSIISLEYEKHCIECGKTILQRAKYCDKCGAYQL